MSDICVAKSKVILPFINGIEQLNIPIAQYAASTNLSINVIKEIGCLVSERSIWRLLELISVRENIPTLGYLLSKNNVISNSGVLTGIQLYMAPTLLRVLELFIKIMVQSNVGLFYSLQYENNGIWFSRVPPFTGRNGSWQVEQYFTSTIIQIVRLCAGSHWLPAKLKFNSSFKEQTKLPEEWLSCETEFSRTMTQIFIPNDVLALAPIEEIKSPSLETLVFEQNDYSLTLENLIKSQIFMGKITIDDVANDLGMSASTFKRRLKKVNQTYRDVLENTRFNIAKRVLEKGDTSILELSQLLKYQHPENFSRSFKKISGQSPTAYKKRFHTG